MSHEHPFNGASFVVQIEGEEEEGFGLFFLLDCRKEKEGMLGTDGGVFPFFFAWGSLFPFGGWVGEMGWGLPSLPPRSEPIFFPFWCLINNKREERDLHCAVVQLSIRFVLFSPLETFRGKGVWRTFCSRLWGSWGHLVPLNLCLGLFVLLTLFLFWSLEGGMGHVGPFVLEKPLFSFRDLFGGRFVRDFGVHGGTSSL